MNRTNFTAIVPPETKLAIIRKIPAYLNQKCNASYYYLQSSDTFTVDLMDEEGVFLAELVFSDKGVTLVKKPAKKLKIDVKGLTDLWTEELIENFGSNYLDYLNSTKRKDEFTL